MATPFRSSPVLIMSVLGSWWTSGPAGRRARGRAVEIGWWHRIVADRSRAAGRRLLPDDDEFARELRQPLDAASAPIEEDEVLDPDPGFSLEVDPRFDREHRLRRQRRIERGT